MTPHRNQAVDHYNTGDRHLIYTAADGNYSLQAAVLLLSLVKTQRHSTHLVIFGNGWSDKDRDRISQLTNGSVTAEIVPVDEMEFAGVRLTNKFPLATAYNVLAPEYLIGDNGRALYIDADMVVCDDLSELWSIQMDQPVAAVVDAHIGWVANPTMWRPWREEALEPRSPYLNTGTMLIDLDNWRQSDLTSKILSLLNQYSLPCVDQDALNLVLGGGFLELPARYNSMPYHILSTFRHVDAVTPDREINDALTRPAILHFHRSFLGKPWTFGSAHPATNLWRTLADEAYPRWRRSFDVAGLARRFAARRARMLVLDPRAHALETLSL